MKPWFIGYAFRFSNSELKFNFFGSPFEILQKMKQANIDPKYAASHNSTEIGAHVVHKDGRVGTFSGGPNAPGITQLLETMAIKNWSAAGQVLSEYPTLLSSGDETGSVPLCINAALGQVEAVKFLIANGASVNGAGKLGMTPLHWAAVHNQPAVVEILLDAGADRSLRSWFFLNAPNLAHANRHIEILRLLAPESPEASIVKLNDIFRAMGCAVEK